MDYEDRLKQQLADLHREYQTRAQPIIDALAHIESMKPPKPIVISMGDLDGLLPSHIDHTKRGFQPK